MKNKKIKSSTLTFIFIIVWFNLFGQAPGIEWQNTIGGDGLDELHQVFQESDGGYILAGYSSSDISGDKTEENFGSFYSDYWIVKINSTGLLEWQNTIGGNNTDNLWAMDQTSDGGYILGGSSSSGVSEDKIEPLIGSRDYWVIKLNSIGEILWQKVIGGEGADNLLTISQTIDGGYILGGYSTSNIFGDKIESCLGGYDYWVVKLNNLGVIEWQNTIGGNSNDYLFSVQPTNDGGYILGGFSASGISGDKSEPSFGGNDYWIVKINSAGIIEWQNSMGGAADDRLFQIEETFDGGFIAAGWSNSSISEDKVEDTIGKYDCWVVKLNNSGEIEWQNTIGGTSSDFFNNIHQTLDGGFILGGYSESGISGDKTEPSKGTYDYWIIKLLNNGDIDWQKTIGGNDYDALNDINETSDGGYILGGSSWSGISGDKTEGNLVASDYWVIKLEAPMCIPSPELCNSLDDNCNGLIDDDITETISITAGGPISFCQGGSVLLTATYSGATIQWKKNGTNIPGATGATYNVTTKGNYSCVTTSACGTAESTPIFVNVIKNPNASISAGGPTTFCAGGSVVLAEVAVAGCTYQWYKGATPIAGATSLTYTVTTAGNYKCRVTKTATGCYKNSNAIAVSVPCREGDNIIENTFSLYPNPTNNFITIETDFSTEKTIYITDALGQIVKSTTTSENNITIDLQGIASGIYFIKMEDGINTVTQKFVKQ